MASPYPSLQKNMFCQTKYIITYSAKNIKKKTPQWSDSIYGDSAVLSVLSVNFHISLSKYTDPKYDHPFHGKVRPAGTLAPNPASYSGHVHEACHMRRLAFVYPLSQQRHTSRQFVYFLFRTADGNPIIIQFRFWNVLHLFNKLIIGLAPLCKV